MRRSSAATKASATALEPGSSYRPASRPCECSSGLALKFPQRCLGQANIARESHRNRQFLQCQSRDHSERREDRRIGLERHRQIVNTHAAESAGPAGQQLVRDGEAISRQHRVTPGNQMKRRRRCLQIAVRQEPSCVLAIVSVCSEHNRDRSTENVLIRGHTRRRDSRELAR